MGKVARNRQALSRVRAPLTDRNPEADHSDQLRTFQNLEAGLPAFQYLLAMIAVLRTNPEICAATNFPGGYGADGVPGDDHKQPDFGLSDHVVIEWVHFRVAG